VVLFFKSFLYALASSNTVDGWKWLEMDFGADWVMLEVDGGFEPSL
jgi:hypothetical protein